MLSSWHACVQVKTDRPVWYLSVICGALLRVIQQVNLRSADYLGFLEKGQLPPAKLTLTSFEQQLVLEGVLFDPTKRVSYVYFAIARPCPKSADFVNMQNC